MPLGAFSVLFERTWPNHSQETTFLPTPDSDAALLPAAHPRPPRAEQPAPAASPRVKAAGCPRSAQPPSPSRFPPPQRLAPRSAPDPAPRHLPPPRTHRPRARRGSARPAPDRRGRRTPAPLRGPWPQPLSRPPGTSQPAAARSDPPTARPMAPAEGHGRNASASSARPAPPRSARPPQGGAGTRSALRDEAGRARWAPRDVTSACGWAAGWRGCGGAECRAVGMGGGRGPNRVAVLAAASQRGRAAECWVEAAAGQRPGVPWEARTENGFGCQRFAPV